MELIVGGGIIVALLGLMTLVAHSNAKNDTKVSRVYQRIDEVKQDTEVRFQHKNVCEILSKTIVDQLTELRADVKLLLKRNGQS
jgi:hypothetical protein